MLFSSRLFSSQYFPAYSLFYPVWQCSLEEGGSEVPIEALFFGKYLVGLGIGYCMSEYSILYGQFKNEMKKGKQFDL